MPISTIVILSVIIAAFAVFGLVLAWGEMQTRHLGRDTGQRKSADHTASVTVIRPKGQDAGQDARQGASQAVHAEAARRTREVA